MNLHLDTMIDAAVGSIGSFQNKFGDLAAAAHMMNNSSAEFDMHPKLALQTTRSVGEALIGKLAFGNDKLSQNAHSEKGPSEAQGRLA